LNPILAFIMNLLRQQQRAPRQEGRSGQGSTPGAQTATHQMDQNFYNPGGGTMGNDTVGGGSVFGGFYRGQPLSSYYGVQPNVGNTAWLGGGAPGQYGSGFSNQAPAWGAQNWLQGLLQMSQPNQAPYGYGQPGGGIFGTQTGFLTGENQAGQQGPQYHGGGPGMEGFLSGGQNLSSMDSLFRGGSGNDGLGTPGDPYLV
jgi:hypothetical protein